MANHPEFLLKFSHNIIEHLGLKLYQNKPTNVIAELVSNSWDANANNVWIDIYSSKTGAPESMVISDNGYGMSAQDLKDIYLIVGKKKRVDRSPTGAVRPPMGRKGIGKLAPFGVAKLVHVLSIKNNLVNWLKLDYDQMLHLKEGEDGELTTYEPVIIADNMDITSFFVFLNEQDISDEIKNSVSKIISSNENMPQGTAIICENMTLRKTISTKALKESLGRRFTVTLNRDDFIVAVNDSQLDEKVCLPDWNLRIPPEGMETTTVEVEINGQLITKEIKHWVGFVKEAGWPQEQAGIGIYAHGKIAQDRPFFFGTKGREIFTRYMYGVIEADWVDELDEDTISTDRTSIDWENPIFDKFHTTGKELVNGWLNKYIRFKEDQTKEKFDAEADTYFEKHEERIALKPKEKEHIKKLLADVTSKIEHSPEDTEKLFDATIKAWIHEPARRVIQNLWQETSKFDPQQFPVVLNELVEELVPESLSLAVTVSQRVYALTKLNEHIALGNETQLQRLIEDFPWILGKEYEAFIFNKTLKKVCDEAAHQGHIEDRTIPSHETDKTRPDFVIFATGNEKDILVVELKGPNIVADSNHLQQLNSYVLYLSERYADANVQGILIAQSFNSAVQKKHGDNLLKTWHSVLAESRAGHISLIEAMLIGTDAPANDPRVQQICQLGGAPMLELLKQAGSKNPELGDLMKKLEKK